MAKQAEMKMKDVGKEPMLKQLAKAKENTYMAKAAKVLSKDITPINTTNDNKKSTPSAKSTTTHEAKGVYNATPIRGEPARVRHIRTAKKLQKKG